MTISAPAKINLNLRIHGLRGDGFHEIETLMAPVASLCDTLDIELGGDCRLSNVDCRDFSDSRQPTADNLSSLQSAISLTCDDPSVPTDERNLIVRAAKMFFEARGGERGVRIHLTKRIPMQAGLGGGSSDAAATLRALNQLCGNPFSIETLESLAARLGADAAWFVCGEAAVCRGRGEIIGAPIPLSRLPILLVKPPFGVSTPWAYRAWDELEGGRELLAPATQTISLSRVSFEGAESSLPLLIFNDLETPVFAKYPLLPVMKNWLCKRTDDVLAATMSGSGSTLFAILREGRDARSLAAQLRAKFGETLWVHLPCLTDFHEEPTDWTSP